MTYEVIDIEGILKKRYIFILQRKMSLTNLKFNPLKDVLNLPDFLKHPQNLKHNPEDFVQLVLQQSSLQQ